MSGANDVPINEAPGLVDAAKAARFLRHLEGDVFRAEYALQIRPTLRALHSMVSITITPLSPGQSISFHVKSLPIIPSQVNHLCPVSLLFPIYHLFPVNHPFSVTHLFPIIPSLVIPLFPINPPKSSHLLQASHPNLFNCLNRNFRPSGQKCLELVKLNHPLTDLGCKGTEIA